MLTDPTVHTGHVTAAPHPEGEALRVELELAAERLQAATRGLIDGGLLPAPAATASDVWHRVARRVHQEMHHDPGEPCQRCVDWTRAAMAEVQPELAQLAGDVRWLRKTKLQLTQAIDRLVADLAAARARIAAVRTAMAGLDSMAAVLRDERIADATPDQLGELAERFMREHEAMQAALADDAAPAEMDVPGEAAALLDVRVMRAVTSQRDQAVNDLDRVTGERDRLVNEMELMAVEVRQLRNVNGLLEQALDHVGEVFQAKDTGKHGWRCVMCDWLGSGLDSEMAAYQELTRHWSTVDHDGSSAREELAALQARVQELLGPIRPELAETPEQPSAEVVGL
ncbi:hypothetical protein [Kutzneria buriramensis]|uniref:Uncharacterized protein n=1 Tax=Kutzneria buriramensis TaxID=1045776 RepID=A0A3E0HEJ0_9PSEU|nr:hypothetical protein [Kutzneria buriramensis]REH43617.1 hypothetical protein BCF44_109160 [Kutzneria buriramensis]